MKFMGILVISGNWVNMTYLYFWTIAQAGYIPGIQHKQGTSLELKRTQFYFN